jgi:MoaA/NifB/PqqE/SkfB family radical SAM enzyme
VYISTNADVLMKKPDGGVAELEELFDAGVNCVNLNIYDPGQEQHDAIWSLANQKLSWSLTEHKYQRHGSSRRLVAVTDMRPERITSSKTDMFYDRTAEDRHEGVPQLHCARPHRHIVVLHDGRVPLCCALDPTALEDELVVGKFPEKSLVELWNSEIMFKYRWHLQQKRRDLPGCSTCTHRMSYSHVVRRVTAPEELLKSW